MLLDYLQSTRALGSMALT
uniref:Uncharacterized protein n=1 Tax=Rhizophora mucronata TaxID=61149 RepID=A0A2P2IUX2_RHIMU